MNTKLQAWSIYIYKVKVISQQREEEIVTHFYTNLLHKLFCYEALQVLLKLQVLMHAT